MNSHISHAIRYHRTLFLSDFHIGAKSFDAEALLSFLKTNESETLYLVGDIIDGWKLKKRWFWTDHISAVLDELVRKVHEGTKIIYIPGNHDEEVRTLPLLKRLRFSRRMNITIRNRIIHRCADGRRFLVMHGDQFDRKILSGSVSKLSDRIYDFILDIFGAHAHMTIMIDGKKKNFSLAKYLSGHGQKALHFLNNFEQAIVREARCEGVHGLICGHTHIPALKKIKDITYANCGSWLRTGHTALAEDFEGRLSLIDWPVTQKDSYQTAFGFVMPEDNHVQLVPNAYAYRPVTNKLTQSIRRVWNVRDQSQNTPDISTRLHAFRTQLALNQAALHKIMLEAVQGDIRVCHKISWDGFEERAEPSFIFKFGAKA